MSHNLPYFTLLNEDIIIITVGTFGIKLLPGSLVGLEDYPQTC